MASNLGWTLGKLDRLGNLGGIFTVVFMPYITIRKMKSLGCLLNKIIKKLKWKTNTEHMMMKWYLVKPQLTKSQIFLGDPQFFALNTDWGSDWKGNIM